MIDYYIDNYSTLFLDRDGVINVKIKGYVIDFSDFVFIKGVKQSLSQLNQIFNRIIIVTNQQGIGKGLMHSDDLDLLHNKMCSEISKYGGNIDQIYYCPHLADAACICRKPKPGMIYKAKNDFPDIDFKTSILIGDSESDIQAAESAGIKSFKVSQEFTFTDWTNSFINR